MNQIPLSASAPALAITLLLVTAAPAAALTDVVRDTVQALPGVEDATGAAGDVAAACRDAPGPQCAESAERIGSSESRDATEPARLWFGDFRQDPVGVLAAEAGHLAEATMAAAGAVVDWLGRTLERQGVSNPFGGDP